MYKKYVFGGLLGLAVLTLVQFLTLAPQNTKLNVYFLDVGQGDSIFISYPTGERMLIDTGKDSKVFRELDKVLPWYDKTIDYVLLSHGDLDHVGAMIDIFDRYKVKKLFVNEFFGDSEVEKQILSRQVGEGASVHFLKKGDVLTFGTEVQNSFKILHPDSTCFEIHKNENDCSLTALLTYGEQTFLLTGDIGKEVERQIDDHIPSPVTVLKVAHHGSRNSSDLEFLQTIKPQYSVIQSGENSYGHPHQDALDNLAAVSTTVFSTKEDATIVASSDGKEFEIRVLFDQTGFFKSSVCAVLLYGFDTSC